MATMGVKGLIKRFDAFVLRVDRWFCWAAILNSILHHITMKTCELTNDMWLLPFTYYSVCRQLAHYQQKWSTVRPIIIIIIILIIIPGQCLWCCHLAVAAFLEFTLVHAVSAARRQVAADLWTKPIGLNHKPACRLPVKLAIAILLLLSPKADTHFTIPRKVEG